MSITNKLVMFKEQEEQNGVFKKSRLLRSLYIHNGFETGGISENFVLENFVHYQTRIFFFSHFSVNTH